MKRNIKIKNIFLSIISKDILVSAGWHKMSVHPIVGFDTQVDHHQFQDQLDLMVKTTCPGVLKEELGDDNVQYAEHLQMCTVLNVRYIYVCLAK